MGVPRSMWSGTVSWGLVTIPVKMGRATSDDSTAMHQVHTEDGGRIRYAKTCETCGKTVQQADIGKGAELASGETVMLSDDDLANLPLPTLKTASVDYFCDAAEIDPVSQDTSYYLWPAPGGGKAYRLLLEALDDAGKVAVCRIAIRSRESLAVIMPENGALKLVTLYWPAEVRDADFVADLLAEEPEPAAAERTMAASLIEAGTRKFDPSEHHDRYSEAVRAMVDGRTTTPPPPGSGTAGALDLQATLEASLALIREKRAAKDKPAPRKSRAKVKS